jgi:hypothetical protein
MCGCATQSTAQREPAPPEPLPLEQVASFEEPTLESVPDREAPVVEPEAPSLGQQIATAATSLLGAKLTRVSKKVPDDCTGLVRLAYFTEGIDLMAGGNKPGENGVSAIWRLARAAGATHFGTPAPGDLVFFVETYDRNRDGKRNDGRTHIGVVESVDAEGTVFFVHRSGRGVNRSRLNRQHPGRPLNEILRPAKGELRAYNTGELFAGFARPAELLAVAPTAPRPLRRGDELPRPSGVERLAQRAVEGDVTQRNRGEGDHLAGRGP